MALEKLTNGNTDLSIIVDPFRNDSVTGINIFFREYDKWSGSIEFRNGNTTGKQSLVSCDSLDGIVSQIKAISDSLKNKS